MKRNAEGGMRVARLVVGLVLAAGLAAGTVTPARAETWYWKGVTTDWTSTANWTNSAGANPGGSPFPSTDDVVIDVPAGSSRALSMKPLRRHGLSTTLATKLATRFLRPGFGCNEQRNRRRRSEVRSRKTEVGNA